MSDAPKDLRARENLREWLDLYAHAIPKESVEGQMMDAQEIIEQQQARISGLEAQIENKDKYISDVDDIICNSQGVAGWHLNGEIATWDELGLFEPKEGGNDGK